MRSEHGPLSKRYLENDGEERGLTDCVMCNLSETVRREEDRLETGQSGIPRVSICHNQHNQINPYTLSTSYNT